MMKRCTSSSVGSGLSTVATSVGSNDMPEGGRGYRFDLAYRSCV